jgi:hypothetical protein
MAWSTAQPQCQGPQRLFDAPFSPNDAVSTGREAARLAKTPRERMPACPTGSPSLAYTSPTSYHT